MSVDLKCLQSNCTLQYLHGKDYYKFIYSHRCIYCISLANLNDSKILRSKHTSPNDFKYRKSVHPKLHMHRQMCVLLLGTYATEVYNTADSLLRYRLQRRYRCLNNEGISEDQFNFYGYRIQCSVICKSILCPKNISSNSYSKTRYS